MGKPWETAESGGALPLANAGVAGAHAGSSPAAGGLGLQAPEKPLCPPDYEFDYNLQACFGSKNGHPEARPSGPGISQYYYACRCKPGESFIHEFKRCWTRGQPGIPASWYGQSDGAAHGGLSGGDGGDHCPFHEAFDLVSRRCQPVECLAQEGWIETEKRCDDQSWRCRGNQEVGAEWTHLVGDCDNSAALITPALQRGLDWVTPAYKFLDFLQYQPSDYREALWNFGFTGGKKDPSMLRWFGEYSDYVFDLILWVMGNVRDNFSSAFIRCHDVDVCSGAPAYSTGQGYVHLCPGWADDDPNHTPDRKLTTNARAILHEMIHFAGIYKVVNFPRDVKTAGCDGTKSKCYHDNNAIFLADHTVSLRDTIYDQQTISHHNVAACVANVDNYVAWLRWRFNSFQFCAVPPGSPAPPDYHSWPDP